MSDFVQPGWLEPSDVAARCLLLLHGQLGPLNTDVDALFGVHKPGDIVELQKPGSDETVRVELATITDVAFGVTTDDLCLPIDDFADQFLVPAMMGLAESIKSNIDGAGPDACFASAPMELSFGLPSAARTYNGLSVRAGYCYDIALAQFVTFIDVLYGVTSAQDALSV